MVAEDDVTAFEQLFHSHWQSLFDNAYKRLKNVDQCKDIVQDVLINTTVDLRQIHARQSKLKLKSWHVILHMAIDVVMIWLKCPFTIILIIIDVVLIWELLRF